MTERRTAATDLELLQVEVEVVWRADARGRLEGPRLVIASTADAHAVAFGREVPDALAADIEREVSRTVPRPDPEEAPASLTRCRELLTAALGPVEVASGPSYVITDEVRFDSPVEVLRSDRDRVAAIQLSRPDEWERREWQELLDGRHRPWAMVGEGGRVVSLCHTARNTERGVEAGVWTHPDVRARGYAAAVTAAWSESVVPSGRYCFYSTSSDNASSQRVAARLKLRAIGWLWTLR